VQCNDVFNVLMELRVLNLQLARLWQECVQHQGEFHRPLIGHTQADEASEGSAMCVIVAEAWLFSALSPALPHCCVRSHSVVMTGPQHRAALNPVTKQRLQQLSSFRAAAAQLVNAVQGWMCGELHGRPVLQLLQAIRVRPSPQPSSMLVRLPALVGLVKGPRDQLIIDSC
jgi:hypothetical protein